tara:strand:- start:336 stop:563 length:228 start_codon:yes stop_codon:yes gene_type:complete
MSAYKGIKDEPDFVRDAESGAVININRGEIHKAREQKRIRQLKQAEEKQLKAEVESLKTDINDIKSMLSAIVEKL